MLEYRKLSALVVAVATVAVFTGAPSSGAERAIPTYTYVDLGVLSSDPNSISAAHDVNDAGQVVGASETDVFGATHAFLWEAGQMVDLGTVGGGAFAASFGAALSADGTVVGYSHVNDTDPPHAFVGDSGGLGDLGTGFGPGSSSAAWDRSTLGRVVGQRSRSQSSALRAVMWVNGRIRDLGTLGGHDPFAFGTDAIAYAVNDRGQVVGTALPPQPPLRPFLWQRGTMTDLGNLGGTTEAGAALDLNELPQVVGYAQTANGQIHAFLWQGGVMTDLGTLGGTSSAATGINESGWVVGGSRTASSPAGNAGHAFVWDGVQLRDLNNLAVNLPDDVVLESAEAISDSGLIVGVTCTAFCEPGATAPTHAFLLIPT
jgi:probable HAF family extracellular repeat protein